MLLPPLETGCCPNQKPQMQPEAPLAGASVAYVWRQVSHQFVLWAPDLSIIRFWLYVLK